MNLQQKLLPGVQLILATLVTLWTFVIMPVCPAIEKNGMKMYMSCHDSSQIVIGIGIVLILVAFAQIFLIKCKYLFIGSAVLQILGAAAAYMIPHRIIPLTLRAKMDGTPIYAGICGKEGMACIPSFSILTWILLVVGLIALIQIIVKYTSKE